jgi:hypothetical protein
VFDWFRAASVALGEVFAALEPRLTMVVAHIPIILLDALQIGVELIIVVIFQLAYGVPPTNTNPLQNIDAAIIGIGDYCLSNTSTAHAALLNLYNGSAAIGLLFGCTLPVRESLPTLRSSGNATGEDFPLESAGAICEESVAGCLALSIYRVLVETVDILEKLLCLFGQLVQFDPTLRTFADISLDRGPSQPPTALGLTLGQCSARHSTRGAASQSSCARLFSFNPLACPSVGVLARRPAKAHHPVRRGCIR